MKCFIRTWNRIEWHDDGDMIRRNIVAFIVFVYCIHLSWALIAYAYNIFSFLLFIVMKTWLNMKRWRKCLLFWLIALCVLVYLRLTVTYVMWSTMKWNLEMIYLHFSALCDCGRNCKRKGGTIGGSWQYILFSKLHNKMWLFTLICRANLRTMFANTQACTIFYNI